MSKPRPKRSAKLPVADRRGLISFLMFLALAVFVAGAARWYVNRPQPSVWDETPLNFSATLHGPTVVSDRVCLALSPLAPDSDMSELDLEFKSLQRHGKLFSVRRSEWDDAGDRLRSYFEVEECK